MTAPPDFHSKLDAMSLAELHMARVRTIAAYELWCNAVDCCDGIPFKSTQFDWTQVIAEIEKRIAKLQGRMKCQQS